MKNRSKRNTIRGSALLAALIVIVILTFAAAGVLSYSLTTYRNSVRQAMLDQGKVIADSEMENLYYNWKYLLLRKFSVDKIDGLLGPAPTGSGLTDPANTTPFDQKMVKTNGWSVTRYTHYNPIATPSGAATGMVAGTNQVGNIYFFTAETSATINLPLLGNVTYKSGRTFEYSSTSLFQFAVFYQGNLEIGAGGNMTIGGPISTNASANLGAQYNNGAPFTLALTDNVYYFQDYNGNSNPLQGETDYIPFQDAPNPSLVDPVYNPGAADIPPQAAPANQAAQRAIQVSKLASQASFIGAVDVAADIANPAYAAAYTNLQGIVDPNEIYRAVVAPPPVSNTTGALLPEDQTVAGSRMYNTAGIVITITQTTPGTANLGVGDAATGSNITIHSGISPQATTPPSPTNLDMYDGEAWAMPIVNPTNHLVTAPVITAARQVIIDPREALNGATGVNLTTVDVGALNIALQGGAMAANHDLSTNYNGVVYVYDNSNNAGDNSHSFQTPLSASANLNGILLTNGTTTPAFNDQNGTPIGFSVVSDNGVYVKGDYNKTPITINGQSFDNPASIMGDAVTVVSSAWTPAAAATLTVIGSREAAASGPTAGTGGTSPNFVNPADAGTANGMTVNAAILTGNTPTSGNVGSGGAQNLVRMIEDWFYPNLTLNLTGSLGQIFTSKYFSGAYAPGVQNGLGAGNRVYIQPTTRVLTFDPVFKAGYTPASSPSTTGFARGPFFNW